MKVYKVNVETTGDGKTTYGPGKGNLEYAIPFHKCIDSVLYVMTNDPKNIYDAFPKTKRITELGIGYFL